MKRSPCCGHDPKHGTRIIVRTCIRQKHVPDLIGVFGDRDANVFFSRLMLSNRQSPPAACSEKMAKLTPFPIHVAPKG
jgi:hypothetical protein